MGICKYLAETNQTPGQLAKRCGVPTSTVYRWKKEEEKTGRVRIDSDNLLKLVTGTDGKITADAVIGFESKVA